MKGAVELICWSGCLTHWGRHKMDVIFQTTFSNAFSWIKLSESWLWFHMKFVPEGAINNIPALVQIMAWRRSGDKPLSEAMMVSLSTHICVTRPQWVKWVRWLAWWSYHFMCYATLFNIYELSLGNTFKFILLHMLLHDIKHSAAIIVFYVAWNIIFFIA